PMSTGEMILKIAKGVHDAARIFLAESAEQTVGAAGIVGKYRLEMRWALLGGMKLFGGEGANPDHADIAVAPGLRGDPLDEIVAIPKARTAIAGFTHVSRRPDDMNIAA